MSPLFHEKVILFYVFVICNSNIYKLYWHLNAFWNIFLVVTHAKHRISDPKRWFFKSNSMEIVSVTICYTSDFVKIIL